MTINNTSLQRDLTANNVDTADIYATVTLDGVTAVSNKTTVEVTTSINSLKRLINSYTTTGNILLSIY